MNTMSGVLYLQSSEQVQANCILKLGHLFFFPAISTFSDCMFAGLLKNKTVHKDPASSSEGRKGQKGPALTKAKSGSSLACDGLTLLQMLARLLQQARLPPQRFEICL